MNLKIVSLNTFAKDVKRLFKKYRRLSKDLRTLQTRLMDNPKMGIYLGDGLYKLRLNNSSIPKGKNAGFRVVYYYFDGRDELYLLTLFSKNDLENINHDTLLELLDKNLKINFTD